MNKEMEFYNFTIDKIRSSPDYTPDTINDTIYALLLKLKERYAVYFGEKSLEKFLSFVYGYMECMKDRDNILPTFLGMDFQCYIANIYGMSKCHWSTIIRMHSETEEAAFDRFYEHMEQFLQQRKEN